MTEIHLPDTCYINGVFLLTLDDLKELDAILAKAKREIRRKVSIHISRAVDAEIKSYQAYPSIANTPEEEVKKKIIQRYPYNVKTHSVTIKCKSGKTIKGSSFEQIASDPDVEKEYPENAKVEIRNAEIQLSLELFDDNFFSYRFEITCSPRNQAFSHRVVKLIKDWAESKRKYVLWYKYWHYIILASFTLFFMWLALAQSAFIETSSGKVILIQKAHDLSKQGIDSTNQSQAIDILLRLMTGNYEGSKIVGIHTWFKIMPIIFIGLFLLGILCPKPVLGIGRGRRKILLYKFIRWFFYGFVVIWVYAILSSALGSWVYDYMKSSGWL
ncbi:MAG: hypothetical protein ABSB95_16535 [Dissulfurispiraceae bacterium]